MMRTILIGLTIAFAVPIPLIVNLMMVQAQNATLPLNTNNTRAIWNLKNQTITLVNTTTNETISVNPFPEKVGNMTTNETPSGSIGNMTTNETPSGSIGNMTTNDSLSEKFTELGK